MKYMATALTTTALLSALAMVPAASAMEMGVQTMNNKATITLTDNGQALANQAIQINGTSQQTVMTDQFGRAIVENQENGVRYFTFTAQDEQGQSVSAQRALSGTTL